MQNEIWLYQSHRNFESGRTKLQKGAVFETNYWLLILGLLLVLALLWFVGAAFRQSIRFSQDGRETVGTVTDCRYVSGKGSHTTVSYEYSVDGQDYQAQDAVSYWNMCEAYRTGTIHPVYYLVDEPTVAGIGKFLHDPDWTGTWIYTGFSLLALMGIFLYMLKNREERYKHAALQRAGIVLEGRVMEIGTSHANKSFYTWARYQFQTPNGHYLANRIESRKAYKWPQQIQEGDMLHILYIDDETYCVL